MSTARKSFVELAQQSGTLSDVKVTIPAHFDRKTHKRSYQAVDGVDATMYQAMVGKRPTQAGVAALEHRAANGDANVPMSENDGGTAKVPVRASLALADIRAYLGLDAVSGDGDKDAKGDTGAGVPDKVRERMDGQVPNGTASH
jgi:hypothetical protein